jgi:hypothetical protein
MATATVTAYPETVPSWTEELERSRCDRCSAVARLLLTGPAGTLTLCAHHWAQHEERLTLAGFAVRADSREELTKSN